jgi:cytochrome c2
LSRIYFAPFVASFMIVSSTSSFAQQATFICNAKSLLTNVRAGDSAKNFGIVTSLGNGSEVSIIQTRANSEGHQWSEIRFKDPQSGRMREGWVHSPTLGERCGNVASNKAPAARVEKVRVEPIDYRLASLGEKLAKPCSACHTMKTKEERKHFIGPHLGGIFTRKIASVEPYNYSLIMKKFTALEWTPQRAGSFISSQTIISPLDTDGSKCRSFTLKWSKINSLTGKPEVGEEYDLSYDEKISAIVHYLRTIN